MQNIPQEQIIKRFQALPDALKDAIFSSKTTDSILKNCALRDIPGDKIHLVGQLTSDVLLGYLRPELFAQEIQKETGIEELKAQHIAHDIDSEIFSEVRLELKKLYPPTILTPNVQNKGFSSDYTSAAPAPVAKPKYVIPIPEKFQNKSFSFPGITPTPIKQETPAPAPEPVTTPKPVESNPVTPQQTPEPIVQKPVSESTHTPTAPQEIKEPENKNILVEKKFEPIKTETPHINTSSAQNQVSQTQTTPQHTQTSQAPKIGEKPAEKPSVKIAQTVEPSGVKIDPVVPLPTFIGSRFQKTLDATPKDSDEKIKEMASKFVTSSTAQPKPPQESAYKEKVDEAKKQGAVDLSKF